MLWLIQKNGCCHVRFQPQVTLQSRKCHISIKMLPCKRLLTEEKNTSIRRMGCSLITTSNLEWYCHLTNNIVTIELGNSNRIKANENKTMSGTRWRNSHNYKNQENMKQPQLGMPDKNNKSTIMLWLIQKNGGCHVRFQPQVTLQSRKRRRV
jgi:hypothetical protein